MAQVEIIKVANYLFGHKQHGKWKPYKSGKPYDCNTLLLPSNTNRTELYIEAMIISNIIEEIMNGDSQTVVTYSNDGSSLNCTGNFVVHSFNINGVQKILPTLGIFAERKRSLAELIQTMLEILSATTGCMYTESQIVDRQNGKKAKIDFVMTGFTLHNLRVIEMLYEEDESEYVSSSLVCNIYPLIIVQRKVKQLFQVIHDKTQLTMKVINAFTLMLISKVNLFHSKPLDASHPSLIDTFLENYGIDKSILMALSI